MSFAEPHFLWLLLGLAPLAWWLATGERPRSRRAPALDFWPRELPARPTQQRRRLPLHAWLALLAVSAAIAALAAPALVREQPLPLRIWLDRSASMSARSAGGATRLAEAKERLARELDAEPRETSCELWLWPAAELGARGTATELVRALERIEETRLAGAEEGPTLGELGAERLWWVGDREPEELPRAAAFFAVGAPLQRNAGWVSASFSAERELWLVAAGAGVERRELEVRVEPGDRTLSAFALEPGERRALRLEVDPAWRALRLVSASGADEIALDDVVALQLDLRPISAVARALPPALQRAFEADERLDFGAGTSIELLIDGAARPASEDPSCALRFGAGRGEARVESLRWEDAESDALWQRLAPAPWPLRELDRGTPLARATPSGRLAIALEEGELHCALDALELAQSASARAELPLLCALLVDAVRPRLRAPEVERTRGAPLDLGETSAALRGSSRSETSDGRFEREQRPLGRWLVLAAAVAWLAACFVRARSARSISAYRRRRAAG
ncbi:MAG: BatA domain-containing protein [Planctomycetes bacterium]|nr:BatA domain-containing protein [Planctomycetota bacterium]